MKTRKGEKKVNNIKDAINRYKVAKLFPKFSMSKLSELVWAVVRLLLILSLAYVILYPVLTKISVAVKDISDYKDSTIMFIPKHFTLQYIKDFMDFIGYVPALFGSIFYASFNSLLQVISCTLVAYGLARFKYKGSNLVILLLLITVIVPVQTILLPLFLQFKYFSFFSLFTIMPNSGGISLLNTYFPYGILSITCLGIKNGLFVLLLRQVFINMPVVLEEAAFIDGYGPFKTFYKIMLPNAVPMLVTIFLFAFVWTWNDNVYSMFFSQDMKLLSVLLNGIGYKVEGLKGAVFSEIYINIAVLLHMIPILILYIFSQRYFVQSIERSGIVG